MACSESRRMAPHNNSRPVLLMLVLLSCGILIFASILIGCAFGINYSTDLRAEDDDEGEPKPNGWRIQVGFNYDQYWAGIPFLATGLFVLLSGIYQRSRTLAIIAVILCIVTIGLSLLVLSLDGRNFSMYIYHERMKIYWESINYTCKTSCSHSWWEDCRKESSNDIFCVCLKNGESGERSRALYHGCEQISKLAGLYASLVVSSIIVALCCVSSLIIIAMSLLRKRTNHTHTDHSVDQVTTNSNAPLLVDLPTTNSGDGEGRMALHEPISTTIM